MGENMAIDKKHFMKTVTILYDTREQKNAHILEALSEMGVMTEQRKLDYGDYSFTADGRDFSLSCVVERKANVDELYTNIMSDLQEKKHGAKIGRLEKEFSTMSVQAVAFTLLLEGVGSWDELQAYEVPLWQMERSPQRVKRDIGAMVYNTLRAWTSQNRYGGSVEFVADNKRTAEKILDIFYYYWGAYKKATLVRR